MRHNADMVVTRPKASGIGPHEQGREAIDFFTRVKTVYINFA
jgi:acyl-CoA reductase-like NAD-dependent aldehyde dehydrogenase